MLSQSGHVGCAGFISTECGLCTAFIQHTHEHGLQEGGYCFARGAAMGVNVQCKAWTLECKRACAGEGLSLQR